MCQIVVITTEKGKQGNGMESEGRLAHTGYPEKLGRGDHLNRDLNEVKVSQVGIWEYSISFS